MKKTLETASSLAVIVAALAVTATAIYDHVLRPNLRGAVAVTFAEQYKGKRLPIPAIGPQPGTTRLVLFVSKTCHFCEESVPFYQRLAAMRSVSSGHFKMIAAVPPATETEAEARERLNEHGISLDDAQLVPFRAIGVNGTPTLVLVDGDAIIRDVWVGKLGPEKEAEVVERIQASCECLGAGAGKR